MVFCIVAFVVFGVLGIFSAKYRTYTKEAFRCMTRQMILKPCDTEFDKKMRAKITGKLAKISPKIAGFTYKNFTRISFALIAIMIISMVFTASSLYTLAVYGSCDPHSTECIFNPGKLTCGDEHCMEEGCECETMGCEAPDFLACEGECNCKECG